MSYALLKELDMKHKNDEETRLRKIETFEPPQKINVNPHQAAMEHIAVCEECFKKLTPESKISTETINLIMYISAGIFFLVCID